jgi:hypothetical protein
MVNYQNGKIYMLESLIGNCRYYGSTTQTLSQRLGKHKQDITKSNITSKEVLQYPDARILLVKKFPCNSVEELEAEEAVFIRNNDCVNKCIPQRTRKEYYDDNRDEIIEYNKQRYVEKKDEILENKKQRYVEKKDEILEKAKVYREEHKDEIKDYMKIYYEEHKEEIKDYMKIYCEEHKDEIKDYMKIYYEEKKDEILEKAKEKITCECSAIVCKKGLTRHCKTQKHLKLLEKLTKSP